MSGGSCATCWNERKLVPANRWPGRGARVQLLYRRGRGENERARWCEGVKGLAGGGDDDVVGSWFVVRRAAAGGLGGMRSSGAAEVASLGSYTHDDIHYSPIALLSFTSSIAIVQTPPQIIAQTHSKAPPSDAAHQSRNIFEYALRSFVLRSAAAFFTAASSFPTAASPGTSFRACSRNSSASSSFFN